MALYRNLRVHQIFGGGTDIGKTLVSTALVKASVVLGEQTSYLKPVGTGTQTDAGHITKFVGSEVHAKCLYNFPDPVSPHLAASQCSSRTDGVKTVIPTDEEFIHRIHQHITKRATALERGQTGALYIESAGGVHSPTLSGTSQMIVYRPLRMPTILIGSHYLGGISSTISAYESLKLHGYDVDALVVLREDYYRNWEYLERWAQDHALRFGLIARPPAHDSDSEEADMRQMIEYYQRISCSEEPSSITALVRDLKTAHSERVNEVDSMPSRAVSKVWWPFVQHTTATKPSDVTVIDSASGDFLLTHQPNHPEKPDVKCQASTSILTPAFDGSASWWTQSLGHAHPAIALSAAYAAGRYGHVLFPRCIHPPAILLIEWLLANVGQGWASRVFFSDNGSTGIEVGLKMGLASYSRRHKLSDSERREVGVLGLRGSYHGDTIGAMDASEPSVYNAEVDWYSGRGFWLDPPRLSLIGTSKARIEAGGDQWGQTGSFSKIYNGLQEVFDIPTRLREDPLAKSYRIHIIRLIVQARQSMCFGSLILEPVVMGAGGMVFVDPLFQTVLIQVVRGHPSLFDPRQSIISLHDVDPASEHVVVPDEDWSGLPVIFDEVFSGLYRLGQPTAAALLGPIHPDIAVYSKILSAGTVPLSVTLARQTIFETFLGHSAPRALLHGHSYTAHPIGCSVALTGLQTLARMESEGHWIHAQANWTLASATPKDGQLLPLGRAAEKASLTWSFWSPGFVNRICLSDQVKSVMCLGTVLAIYLRDGQNETGYTSQAASRLLETLRRQQELLSSGVSVAESPSSLPFKIYARPLGNVAYLICSLNTQPSKIERVEQAIEKALLA
ncbi:hypothetical protein CROQUDRAFT_35372 [Cronartium quercuum f. sp. fusiforme G11]|uniref:Uncharacterized protein n=1 Tax=Cronartium quercuum f. sp. fusiforme G11 TaxID=708437 RepID=A0A9P6NYA1_9BASI|nr:hypothetical protein CROQUDRAFT_35372 [Cronartium quercuum f. sp. fusiforme G11]